MKNGNQSVKDCRARKESQGLKRYDIWVFPELKNKVYAYIETLNSEFCNDKKTHIKSN